MSAPTVCDRRRRLLARGLALLAPLVIIGTLAVPRTVYPDVAGGASPQRIVCLSPAITQMICDLRAGDRIVAVGAYDPVAPQGAAVVGDLYNIEYEKLLSLRPTHVIVQAVKQQPIPERLVGLAERHRWQLVSYPIETLADVGRILPQIGPLLQMPEEAAALARRTGERIAAITELTADRPRPRTLMIVGFSPLTAVAPGTFLDEMLQAAGGRNVLDAGGMLYPVLDRERLIALDPQVIVLITPDPGVAAASDAPARDPIAELKLPASMKPRLVHLTDPTALLPSTTMPRIAAALARGLHPDLADRVDKIVPR